MKLDLSDLNRVELARLIQLFITAKFVPDRRDLLLFNPTLELFFDRFLASLEEEDRHYIFTNICFKDVLAEDVREYLVSHVAEMIEVQRMDGFSGTTEQLFRSFTEEAAKPLVLSPKLLDDLYCDYENRLGLSG